MSISQPPRPTQVDAELNENLKERYLPAQKDTRTKTAVSGLLIHNFFLRTLRTLAEITLTIIS